MQRIIEQIEKQLKALAKLTEGDATIKNLEKGMELVAELQNMEVELDNMKAEITQKIAEASADFDAAFVDAQ